MTDTDTVINGEVVSADLVPVAPWWHDAETVVLNPLDSWPGDHERYTGRHGASRGDARYAGRHRREQFRHRAPGWWSRCLAALHI